MEPNIYLEKQRNSNLLINNTPTATSMINKQISTAINNNLSLNNDSSNQKKLNKNIIELEPAPEVEFASDKRKRIARNVQKVYQFSHGGGHKQTKKKKRKK